MDFQGFQHTFPDVLIVIAIILLVVISWLSYRKVENIPPLPRYVLISFRALALIILLLLLLNPYFYSSREVEIKPKVAVFLDDSESVSVTRGNYEGMESYNSLLRNLNFESLDEADIEYYSIGENSPPFSPDSLTLTATQTNLSSAINTVLEMEEDVRAAVIISDGIITYGKNPAFNASSSSIPLHTIAIGDTSQVKDVSASNVITNSTGYTNTTHRIEAEVSQTGFEGSTITVELVSGDETLLEQQVSFETDDQVKKVDFELELEEEGLKQFEIRTEVLPDEWSESNNSRSFSIDILDSRVKILHISFEVHPDVKTIRTIINEDINNELYTLTWLGDNNFVESIPDEMDFDLVIVHGAPNQNRRFEFLEDLSGIPVLLFSNRSSLYTGNSYLSELQLIEGDIDQLTRVKLHPLLNADEQPILELPDINFIDIPPMLSPRRTSLIEPQAVSLFSMSFEGNETDFPVIAILEQGNIRRAHVYIWNWYLMHQSTHEMHRKFTTDLISNLVSWTSSDPDDRNLQVSPSKQTYSTAEAPSINASLQNESGDKESGAIIEIEILSDRSATRSFNMENSGNGNYTLNLPRFSEGLYGYEATARKGNREIDRQRGEFLVSNSSSELANTHRNDPLLRSLASNSGGRFFTYDNAEGFWDSLRITQVFETQVQTVQNYLFPVRSIFWFVIVLFLLGTEWILRKYYSLP